MSSNFVDPNDFPASSEADFVPPPLTFSKPPSPAKNPGYEVIKNSSNLFIQSYATIDSEGSFLKSRVPPDPQVAPPDPLDIYSHLTTEFVYTRLTEYFYFCTEKQVPPTYNGLALRLDVDVDDLKLLPFKNPSIQFAFKKAKMIISEFVETQLLLGKSPVGYIFWLKNMDNWVDKTEIVSRKGMGEELDELEKRRKRQGDTFKVIDTQYDKPKPLLEPTTPELPVQPESPQTPLPPPTGEDKSFPF